ncbi:hypothetical protein L550_2525 [Bordetella pertussis H973]|uniref:Uncharacterized protein n=2 Tax=Bordetella pertussis TaxID=520 RepID=A0AAI9J4G9_BORPT|nr:hypothetical protein V483_2274 [Bordetella pertussis CHLA-11]ETH05712.1 hypothetical protein L570_2154 [Bordetella pertussis 2356847]ETH10820.1 hypothetical protein L574_2627 [Bordetella pertussis STO1-SEAT-0006]ETH15466.1 hypothetical protein L575_1075 [Bordetella pertussis STO1-SEAT-0007]ETH18276.1 hypothetical protein L563_2180 [Bordetella pertussis CHLA-13]ETH32605.1 hypothetical protein L566_2481 [Bordetella pertussis CHLA-26]ETH34701.1 hypothetical protein L546_2299 [Bordetella pertu
MNAFSSIARNTLTSGKTRPVRRHDALRWCRSPARLRAVARPFWPLGPKTRRYAMPPGGHAGQRAGLSRLLQAWSAQWALPFAALQTQHPTAMPRDDVHARLLNLPPANTFVTYQGRTSGLPRRKPQKAMRRPGTCMPPPAMTLRTARQPVLVHPCTPAPDAKRPLASAMHSIQFDAATSVRIPRVRKTPGAAPEGQHSKPQFRL